MIITFLIFKQKPISTIEKTLNGVAFNVYEFFTNYWMDVMNEFVLTKFEYIFSICPKCK